MPTVLELPDDPNKFKVQQSEKLTVAQTVGRAAGGVQGDTGIVDMFNALSRLGGAIDKKQAKERFYRGQEQAQAAVLDGSIGAKLDEIKQNGTWSDDLFGNPELEGAAKVAVKFKSTEYHNRLLQGITDGTFEAMDADAFKTSAIELAKGYRTGNEQVDTDLQNEFLEVLGRVGPAYMQKRADFLNVTASNTIQQSVLAASAARTAAIQRESSVGDGVLQTSALDPEMHPASLAATQQLDALVGYETSGAKAAGGREESFYKTVYLTTNALLANQDFGAYEALVRTGNIDKLRPEDRDNIDRSYKAAKAIRDDRIRGDFTDEMLGTLSELSSGKTFNVQQMHARLQGIQDRMKGRGVDAFAIIEDEDAILRLLDGGLDSVRAAAARLATQRQERLAKAVEEQAALNRGAAVRAAAQAGNVHVPIPVRDASGRIIGVPPDKREREEAYLALVGELSTMPEKAAQDLIAQFVRKQGPADIYTVARMFDVIDPAKKGTIGSSRNLMGQPFTAQAERVLSEIEAAHKSDSGRFGEYFEDRSTAHVAEEYIEQLRFTKGDRAQAYNNTFGRTHDSKQREELRKRYASREEKDNLRNAVQSVVKDYGGLGSANALTVEQAIITYAQDNNVSLTKAAQWAKRDFERSITKLADSNVALPTRADPLHKQMSMHPQTLDYVVRQAQKEVTEAYRTKDNLRVERFEITLRDDRVYGERYEMYPVINGLVDYSKAVRLEPQYLNAVFKRLKDSGWNEKDKLKNALWSQDTGTGGGRSMIKPVKPPEALW